MLFIFLFFIRLCVIFRVDWGVVFELVLNVLMFEFVVVIVVVELVIWGVIGKKVNIRLNLFFD